MVKNLSLSELLDVSSHHAHLIIGNPNRNLEDLRVIIRKKVSAGDLDSSDVWSWKFEAIGIDDARELKEVQNTRPIGSGRIVVISLVSIQNEAQNSLLKLFEDPSSDTKFFLCAKSTDIFLPTLLSRFYIFYSKNKYEVGDADVVKEFLSSTVTRRMVLLEPIIKEKDKAGAESFLDSLEYALYENGIKGGSELSVFEDIFSARRFLHTRSPSVKMILEHFCCVAPTLSSLKK